MVVSVLLCLSHGIIEKFGDSWYISDCLSKSSACFSSTWFLLCGNCTPLWLKWLWWELFFKWTKFKLFYIMLNYCVICNQDKSRNGCCWFNFNSKIRDKVSSFSQLPWKLWPWIILLITFSVWNHHKISGNVSLYYVDIILLFILIPYTL